MSPLFVLEGGLEKGRDPMLQGMSCPPFLRTRMVAGVPLLPPEKGMCRWDWYKGVDLSREIPTLCMCPQRVSSAAREGAEIVRGEGTVP